MDELQLHHPHHTIRDVDVPVNVSEKYEKGRTEYLKLQEHLKANAWIHEKCDTTDWFSMELKAMMSEEPRWEPYHDHSKLNAHVSEKRDTTDWFSMELKAMMRRDNP
jgi:hypothetical protein